jgi:hypothetical protein
MDRRKAVARGLALAAANRARKADQNFWDHITPRCTPEVYAHENWMKYLGDADAAIAADEAWRGEQRLQAPAMTFDPRHAVAVFGRGRDEHIPGPNPGPYFQSASCTVECLDREDDVDEGQR